MKSSSTNGLRWILALALLAGGARARAQSGPVSTTNSAPNSRSFRAGTGAQKNSAETQQQSPAQPPAQTQEPAATPAPVPPKSVEPPGPIVTSVRIVDENGKVLVESPANISVQAGKPLERDQVADSIRTLYKTGTYSYIAAREDPSGGGVRIDFVVREQLFFNQVIIRGVDSPPSEASAAAAMSLTLGTPYRKEAVEDGVTRLTEALHDEGLYQAEVHVETVPHHDTHELDVIVTVKSGPRAKIQTIQLTNG
ncbi:MAG TPA: POTRA domain-containing protein, partial [Candidatus Sulfotelmatobacter sp.]|nr:POTRA domain-containing protein [Candidatus Sulfotelmatobacter sp.]